jgi:hypothetical protein
MVGDTVQIDDQGNQANYGHGADNNDKLTASQACKQNEQWSTDNDKARKDDMTDCECISPAPVTCDEDDNVTKHERGQK